MAYLLMIFEPRGQRQSREPAQAEQLYEQMLGFAADLNSRGLLLRAESLRPDDHAVRISAPAGKPQMLDGPFAEAKEMIGGFFLIDVATREQAVAIAQTCPAVGWATVEVRECAPCHVV